jgi:hypothetical protein
VERGSQGTKANVTGSSNEIFLEEEEEYTKEYVKMF